MRARVGSQFKAMGAAFAGMFAVSYISNQMKETADYAAKVRDLGNTFGMTTDQIQKLDYAATQSGITIEEVMDAHKDLGKNTAEALMGVESKIWAFKALGISVDEIKGKNIDEVFMRVAKSINEAGPVLEPDQVKAIEDLMGGAGFKSINMMRGDLKEVFTQLEEMGALIDEEAIQKMGALSDKFAAFETKNKSLWAGMLSTMGSGFMWFIDAVSSAVDELAERFVDLANTGKALMNLDFKEAAASMAGVIGGDTGKSAANAGRQTGGLKGAIFGAAGAVFGGIEGTILGGDIRRRMGEKKEQEDALIAAGKKKEAADAEGQQLMQAAQARKLIADDIAKLDEAEAQRRYEAMSAAQQQIIIEGKIAEQRKKLAKLPFWSKESMASITESEAHTDKEKQERLTEMETQNLEHKKASSEMADLQEQKTKTAEEVQKEKAGAAPAMVGENKFSSLARIGGALGGRNPVLDTAKRQLKETEEIKKASEETAQAVQLIAGTK
jgi:hypothetical protein